MTAVLFIAFNRPSTSLQSFEAIRRERPSQLFFACDGPRQNVQGEAERCEKVRSLVHNIDWPCEVHTLFREKNLGCQLAVGGAISWFFENVDAGIILEDDCVPSESFFPFCKELLERYQDDNRIGTITGNNFQTENRHPDADYYLSKHFHCWGWASWKRAWKLYDYNLAPPVGMNDQEIIEYFPVARGETNVWLRILERLRSGDLNTWDYRWQYSLWLHKMACITPSVNLVKNIGFDETATHTSQGANWASIAHTMNFPLRHPSSLEIDSASDNIVSKRVLGLNSMSILKGYVKRRLQFLLQR